MAAPGLSGSQKIRGLGAAALVAWTLIALVDLGGPVLAGWIDTTFFGGIPGPAYPGKVTSMITVYAWFGIPTAFIFCLAIGYPAWSIAERRGKTSRMDAARLGALVGLLAGGINLWLLVMNGAQTALDPRSGYNSNGLGGEVIHDGLPTLLGWAYQALDLALTIATGAIAGLAAHAAAGPPRAVADPATPA